MDKEQTVLSAGGTVPGSTGAAADTPPAGGGSAAVPSTATLIDGGGTPIGDTASMDDGGVPNAPPDEDDARVQEAAGDVNTLTGGTYAMPQASDKDAEHNADAPTGGLSQTGTIGGTPTGATERGMGGGGL